MMGWDEMATSHPNTMVAAVSENRMWPGTGMSQLFITDNLPMCDRMKWQGTPKNDGAVVSEKIASSGGV